jgi:hypothetical protein
MSKTGVVTQLSSGQVIVCTKKDECMIQNNGACSIPGRKACLLSVDHGDRCSAWDNQQTTWLIHENTTLIEQL